MGTKTHKREAPKSIRISIISVSSTRSIADDNSGQWIKKRAIKEGHTVVGHLVVKDVKRDIVQAINDQITQDGTQAIIVTGGTGISSQDLTIEAVSPLFEKELLAFGPVFAQLSFEQIDSAAIMSRATAGIIGDTAVFCIPGSIKACKLACKALIYPELGHVIKHILHG